MPYKVILADSVIEFIDKLDEGERDPQSVGLL